MSLELSKEVCRMFNLFGSKSCGRCEAIKNTLVSRKVQFCYSNLEELDEEFRNEMVSKASDRGIEELPIIIYEHSAITLDELIKIIS